MCGSVGSQPISHRTCHPWNPSQFYLWNLSNGYDRRSNGENGTVFDIQNGIVLVTGIILQQSVTGELFHVVVELLKLLNEVGSGNTSRYAVITQVPRQNINKAKITALLFLQIRIAKKRKTTNWEPKFRRFHICSLYKILELTLKTTTKKELKSSPDFLILFLCTYSLNELDLFLYKFFEGREDRLCFNVIKFHKTL